jgi:hypothetical protein
MMRLPIGLFLPGLVVGLSTALVGPSLVAGPSGEPMLVAAPGQSLLRPASFDGAACASTFLSEGEQDAGEDSAGLRVMAVMMRDGRDEVSVAIREIPIEGNAPAATLVVVIDANGEIRFAGPAGELTELAEQAVDSACGEAAAPGSI